MKRIFDIQHFTRLFINEWMVNKKRVALNWAGMLGIPLLYFSLFASMGDTVSPSGTFMFFYTIILAFQAVMINMHYSDFTSKEKTQSLLLLPASQTEKYTAKFVCGIIIYPLIAIIYLYLMMQITVRYNEWAHVIFGKNQPSSEDWIRYLFDDKILILSLICIWFFSSSAFLWGALTFRKWSIVKTYLFWIVFSIVLFPLTGCIYALISGHFPQSYAPLLYIGEYVDTTSSDHFGYSLLNNYPYFLHWLGIFMGVFLMVISRIKFNEKTI